MLKKSSRGRLGREKVLELIWRAQSSYGIPGGAVGFSIMLKTFAVIVEDMSEKLKELKSQIAGLLEFVPNKLHTVPGMGVISRASFIGELEQVGDFNNSN